MKRRIIGAVALANGTPIAIQDCDHPVKPHWQLCGAFPY